MALWNTSAGLYNLLHFPRWFTLFKRTAFVLRRTRQIRLNKLGALFPKRIKRQGFYYELVENTDTKKKPPVELILKQDVPGVGLKGEKIEENMFIAYKDYLLPKLAIYANSPEAATFRKISDEKQYTSIYSKIVENYLATQAVIIILSYEVKWTLQPWHVKLALRKNGILTNDDCITIPQEISGPNLDIENKDFLIYLTMNKSERFPVRCRIYHWSSSEPILNQKSFDINSPSVPIFSSEKEEIHLLIKAEQEIRKKDKLKRYKVEEREGKK